MKEPYDLAPDDRADVSVRKILRRLFAALRSTVDGVAEDLEVECLHDLRVASRRTRTALSQIKGVLSASAGKYYQPEFKWLGDVTGPCRDLDVFLTALDISRQEYGELGPLQSFLGEKRHREHGLVCAALRSGRFQRLVDDWDRFLETGAGEEYEPPLALLPIIEVAGPQILKAYRRIRKRGRAVDNDPPAALLHRLRIDGKKLRYLLEFFSELYSRTAIERFIKELKQLQDILGGFNDTQVQLALIGEYKEQGSASAEALRASSRLAETITELQRQFRSDFAERFEILTSDSSRKRYRKTFKAG